MNKTKSGLHIVTQEQLYKALDLAKLNNMGLIVLGKPSIGKTMVINSWLSTELKSAVYLVADEIASEYSLNGEKAYYDIRDDKNKIPYTIRKRDPIPLCIDDIGSESDALHFGASRNVIKDVITKMYRNNNTLFGTSNYSIDELQQRYGTRVIERLKEKCFFVVLEGPSYRTGDKNQELLNELLG